MLEARAAQLLRDGVHLVIKQELVNYKSRRSRDNCDISYTTKFITT
jgi:hypothetical protein